jgi:ornithine cyclodeaminase/alanine dehydrogenase-like protein (mu-crystallin family)
MVYSPIKEEALTFAEEMAGQLPMPDEIRVAGSPEELMEADVICTATTSHQPVFPGDQLQPGVHINAIGAFTPEMEEVDLTTLKRSTIYVDSRSAALEEAGDLIGPIRRDELSPEDIFAEIGEVVSGKAQGRTSPDQITYFKSVGVAVQDAVAAGRALRQAQALDIGSVVEL